MKYLKGVKVVGAIGAITTTGLSILKIYNYHEAGGTNSSVYIKGTVDAVMDIVGLFGPIGFAVSSIYFILDTATDGFGIDKGN